MARDVTSQLASYVGWIFLPRYATSFLQSLYYRITIRAGSPHPARGSARHTQHYRRIYLFVISSYLLYTLVEAYSQICAETDFYQILGVLPNTDDRAVKTRFRRLAALHHPDKVQQSGNGDNGDSDGYFVHLKLAQDALLDPMKRFAYDRFGRSVVENNKDESIRGLLYAGLLALLPQYGVGLVTMGVMNMFWFSPWGRYWRFYTLIALFTLEVSLLTHPTGVFMPSAYMPNWLSSILHLDTFYLLPFQILSLARKASMTLNIFISQLTPPEQSRQASTGAAVLSPQLQRQLMQLNQFSRANDAEIDKLLQLELAPFKGDKESVEKLRKEMGEWIAVGSLKESAPVKDAIEKVRERRRDEVH